MSATPSPSPSRWRAIVLGGASSFAARVVATTCGFIQVPVALQFLGTEGFGLWATLQACAALAIMLDLGTGYHLQNAASAANVHGRWNDLSGMLRAAFWTALGVAGLLVAVLLLLKPTALPDLFSIATPALRHDLAGGLGTTAIVIALGVPAALSQRLAIGLQQTWLVGLAQAIASVLSLGLVCGFARQQVSIATFLAGTLAVPVVVNLGLLLLVLGRIGLLRALWHPPSFALWRDGLRGGSLFFVTQLSATFRQAAPPFLVAASLGVAAVTPFNLVQRLLNLLAQPQLWLMEPLWPAYADAHGRGDLAWSRAALKRSYLAAALIAVLPIASSLAWGPRFLEWWTGHPLPGIPWALFCAMGAWYAGTALLQPIAYFLNSLGRLRGQALYGPLTTGLALLLTVPACRAGGLALACVPLAGAVWLINLPCGLLDLRGALRSWSRTPEPVTR